MVPWMPAPLLDAPARFHGRRCPSHLLGGRPRPYNLASLDLLRAPGCCFLHVVWLPGACSRPRPWSSSGHDTPSCRALDVFDEIPQRAPTRSAQPLRDVTNSARYRCRASCIVCSTKIPSPWTAHAQLKSDRPGTLDDYVNWRAWIRMDHKVALMDPSRYGRLDQVSGLLMLTKRTSSNHTNLVYPRL